MKHVVRAEIIAAALVPPCLMAALLLSQLSACARIEKPQSYEELRVERREDAIQRYEFDDATCFISRRPSGGISCLRK